MGHYKSNNLKSKIVKGFSWSFLSQFGRHFINVVIMIFLARLLTPNDFGLIALATTFTGFAIIFSDFGYGAALIHYDSVSEIDYSTVFWFNLVIALFFSILFVLLADLIVLFYEKPEIKNIIYLLSCNFIFNSFAVIQRIKLIKSLNFKRLSIIEILSVVFSGTIAVLFAMNNFGYYSLVIHILMLSFFSNLFLWSLSDWRPSLVFSKKSLTNLNKFSISFFVNQIFNYWTKNIDNLLIGKYIGSTSLGLYSKSYSLAVFRMNSMYKVISNVMFPSLSRIKDNNEKIKSIYLNIYAFLCCIAFPIIFILNVTSETFIPLFFGNQWLEMVPIFDAMFFLMLSILIGSINSNLYLIKGRTDLQLKVGVVFKSINILAIILSLKYGIIVIAYSLGIVSLIGQFPQMFITGKLIDLGLFEIIKSIYKFIIFSVIAWFVIFIFNNYFLIENNLLINFLIQLVLGFASYLILIYFFEKNIIYKVKDLIVKNKKIDENINS